MKKRTKDLFIDGKAIYLRSVQKKDLEGNWHDWLNDEVVTKYQNKGFFPNTPEKQKRYFDYLMGTDKDVVLAIIEKKSGEHIGNVGLHEIEWVHRHATLGIVIGERAFWGKGYGKEAWGLITEYGLRTLNLHRITAYVIADNSSSVNVALKNGFKKEGTMKDYYFKKGRYHDVVVTGILGK